MAKVEQARIKEGEREAGKARRAKERRWVQKRIKVDKARRMVAAAATATTAAKNEEEEEVARRMTADKRRCGTKRQRFCIANYPSIQLDTYMYPSSQSPLPGYYDLPFHSY
jgi:hypothetical protein